MPDKTIVYNLHHPVNRTYPYFSDMERFVSIHPVIYKCEQLAEGSFRLYEQLKIAGISISFSYTVTLQQIEPDQSVIMLAVIRKGITLSLQFDFAATESGTTISESITFKGAAIIRPFFIPFLIRVHRKMIDNLNRSCPL